MLSNEYRAGLRGYAAACLLGFGLAHAAAAAEPVIPINAEQAKALGIEVTQVSGRAGTELQGLAAEVVVPNDQLYIVAAPLAGLIDRLPVAANANVKRGQALAHLQSPMLADVQRGYLQASVQAQLAHDNRQRDEQLFKDGIIAESRLRATRGQEAEAAAVLAERRQALRMAGVSEEMLGRLKSGQGIGGGIDVVAPSDGIVLEQMVAVGTRVEAAAPLFKLARLDPLWLEIQVPLAQIDRVAVGARVGVGGGKASGRVISIGRTAGANQTVSVRAEVAQGANAGAAAIYPGQMVEARIVSAANQTSAPQAWSVPSEAVIRDGKQVLLFVQRPDGYVPTPVQLVSESATQAVVTAELKGDERVAVRGVAALKARMGGQGAQSAQSTGAR